MRSNLTSWSLPVICLSLAIGPPPVAAAGPDLAKVCQAVAAQAVPTQFPLRPVRKWIRELIEGARGRSATLDGLIRAAEASGALVYVDEGEPDQHVWGARTLLLSPSCGYRYLRIELQRLSSPDDAAALLAHELQHVLEIVSSGAATPQDVMRLYRSIGEEAPGTRRPRFDSEAAVNVGLTARQELRQAGGTRSGR